MIFTVTWPRPDHALLAGVRVEASEDGTPVGTSTVAPGRAAVLFSDVATVIRLTVTFTATLGAGTAEVLRVEQELVRTGDSPAFPVFSASQYTVLTGPTRLRRSIPGTHPLATVTSRTLAVRTSLVDVTGLVPQLDASLRRVAPRVTGVDPRATARLLARTDGVRPELWIVTTPHVCLGAPVTDVLGFLGPQQNHGAPPALLSQLADPSAVVRYAAVLLGSGTPDGGGVGDVTLMDRFTPGNVILAKGYEGALVASGRHAVLAIPIPADHSHNAAATSALPGLLADVHRVVAAVGDAHPPLVAGDLEHTAPPAAPRYGVGVHSRGGLALWGEGTPSRPGALTAGPAAYSDLLLFEALGAGTHLDSLARTSGTSVCFVGYAGNVVSTPHATALGMPSLAGRVQRLPVPSSVPGERPPETAPLGQLAAHSPSLARALTGLATPPSSFEDLFALKHQLCTWSGDDAGVPGTPERHFLTQALLGSTLR